MPYVFSLLNVLSGDLYFCTVVYWQTTKPFLVSCGSVTTYFAKHRDYLTGEGGGGERGAGGYLCVHIMWLHVFLLFLVGCDHWVWHSVEIFSLPSWEGKLYISILQSLSALEGSNILGPLGLFVCGMDVPLSYSHTGRYVVLSATLSFKNVLVIITV